jgi:uncharacterized protein YbjQ (UPF0145 family)
MIRIFSAVLLTIGVLLTAPAVEARDTIYKLKIDEVLQNAEFKAKLGNDVRFYFGDKKMPGVQQNFGEIVTNKKTNSVGKPDEEACRWALLSALLALRERARKEGGNAVINIVSYYKKDAFSSATEYECHAGNIIVGVALKATIAKLKQ